MRITGLRKILITTVLLLLTSSFLFARALDDGGATKKLDLDKVHTVGNIWLRVSNYGFFGHGNDGDWPSLEYPGGSGIDYLYQGALWFGAKKIRRNAAGQKLYWKSWPNPDNENDNIPSTHPDWNENLVLVVDTLTSVGFDGDRSLYELLPAYNPTEAAALGGQYNSLNPMDTIMSTSIRNQRRGIDDDGDGKIDEDPVGYSFPFRHGDELPEAFAEYGGLHPHEFLNYIPIEENFDIWYPRGFVNLGSAEKEDYLFTAPYDADGDGLYDEDGAPVSEQDFISFYYDYSPFPDGYTGTRHYGSWTSGNNHYPLNVRVRQLSYQWSFDYIKNLVYVEFNITNMNPQDTLYDCVMGIYMDCDVGPQVAGGEAIAEDDISGYVAGEGFEFAYSYDAPGGQDGSLSQGIIGARVCTPNPDSLEFAAWFWEVGDGPDDFQPRDLEPSGPTANEKYWLLTGKNPDTGSSSSGGRYFNLKEEDQEDPLDTRFLFGFYGDQQGMDAPTTGSWNLAPGKTMKIVVAVFPGDDLEDLKRTSIHAKNIYGTAQTLTTVVEPDIFPHYIAFEPPPIPNMHGKLIDDGKKIDVYWDNRSEIDNLDTKMVPADFIGWHSIPDGDMNLLDSYIPDDGQYSINGVEIPAEFHWDNFNDGIEKPNATINPWTAFRLRHDFQGYALYGRSGSGSQEHWSLVDRWDKIDTAQDFEDFTVNEGLLNPYPAEGQDAAYFVDYGIAAYDATIDKGLPNHHVINDADSELLNYYKLDDLYLFSPYEVGDTYYGYPLYDYQVEWTQDLYDEANQAITELSTKDYKNNFALRFKHPNVADDVFLALYDEKLIPLPEFQGQNVYYDEDGNFSSPPDAERLELQKRDRLARKYYNSIINNPPRGIEYYVAVAAWDRGMPEHNLPALESGRDEDANMRVFFPGTLAKSNMDDIFVTPNPYVLRSKYDGRRDEDDSGDKSRRIWFANLPEKCTIRIYTLAGDLIDTIHHDGNNNQQDIISTSRATSLGLAASGITSWNMLTRYNQIIAPGVYLYSVEDDSGDVKVNKFVIIK